MLDTILPVLLPELQSIAGLVLTAAASWAAFGLKKRFGVDVQIKQIEEGDKLRDLLTMAITTGVKSAMMRGASDRAQDIADEAVTHVISSVPDAITKLGAQTHVIKNRALAVLYDLQDKP